MSETILERESPSWHLPAMIVLGLIAIGGLWFGWNASTKLDTTQQTMTAQIKQSEQSVQQDVSSLKDRLAQDEKANADLQGDLTVVTKKLKITQGQLKTAREDASKANDATSQKLTALDTSVHTDHQTNAPPDLLTSLNPQARRAQTDR